MYLIKKKRKEKKRKLDWSINYHQGSQSFVTEIIKLHENINIPFLFLLPWFQLLSIIFVFVLLSLQTFELLF